MVRLIFTDFLQGLFYLCPLPIIGHPCDEEGYNLPVGSPPPPAPNSERDGNDYTPYSSRAEFELADLLFREVQMSGKKINQLMDIWAAFPRDENVDHPHDADDAAPPFANSADLYNVIDSTQLGDVPWQAFSVTYDGEIPDGVPPTWMSNSHEVWYRDPLKVMENQIGNQDFGTDMDFAPKQVFDKNDKRQYTDFMSGNWAWEQAVCIRHSSLIKSNVPYP